MDISDQIIGADKTHLVSTESMGDGGEKLSLKAMKTGIKGGIVGGTETGIEGEKEGGVEGENGAMVDGQKVEVEEDLSDAAVEARHEGVLKSMRDR